jgi:hypothetical protein
MEVLASREGVLLRDLGAPTWRRWQLMENYWMDTCPHFPIENSLDRWQECHWHIHQMESNYHEPDGFRYSVNSFIRAVKEVPQMLMNRKLPRQVDT